MGHPAWPLYDLRLRTRDLVLRLPDDRELVALCALARAGVHDPAVMPFTVPWTDQPSPQFERSFMRHHWGQRAQWSDSRWMLGLAVFLGDEPIGVQDLAADDFPVLAQVRTGSWLGQGYQRRGFGRQMRAAVLQLAFGELGAVAADSSAFTDNAASLAVSRSLGYQPNGVARRAPRGEPRELLQLRLTREQWQAREHDPVEVTGLAACRDMFAQ